ncbi:hypothetical protein [Marinobacterium arenosum]|uniref:hypothetical protein n=1 Tax=Marinobacterium arenosum TaxID=2862496 RepID=UPI001C96F2FE|nr:hypothetical protein [Marinobacterium arenosum]MBY4676543.1 hypothetical protein [Marinobacterium arenosum]
MLRIGLLLLIVPGLLMMAGYLYEQSLVDACLDSGGSFDFHQGECDLQQQHEFVPYMIRHPLLVNGGMLLSVVGLFCCLYGLYVRAPR